MWKPRKTDLWGVLFLLSMLILVFGAVQYNLAAVSASAQQIPVTVIIDAGHGGEDGGAVGIAGTLESHINLDVARRLQHLLSFFGFQTQMLRTEDRALYSGSCIGMTEKKVSDLKNRVKMINSVPGGLLVSIHQNHFPQEKYSGAQVFYAPTSGSKELAQSMQQFLRSALDPQNHRQCMPASSVYLMEHINCTGVLVECGFLSNHQEELMLCQPSYQKKIVCAITGALYQCRETGEQLEI